MPCAAMPLWGLVHKGVEPPPGCFSLSPFEALCASKAWSRNSLLSPQTAGAVILYYTVITHSDHIVITLKLSQSL